MVLHGALRMIPAAQMRRAVVRCPALGKFSQKGIPLSFNSSLEKFPSPFSQKISQRVHDSVSTRKFDDGSLLHDGGGSFGWWLVSQRQTNKMHRRRSNRPDTRFTRSSYRAYYYTKGLWACLQNPKRGLLVSTSTPPPASGRMRVYFDWPKAMPRWPGPPSGMMSRIWLLPVTSVARAAMPSEPPLLARSGSTRSLAATKAALWR